MGAGPSHHHHHSYEHEYREAQQSMARMHEEAKRHEENERRMREERERMQAENHAKELQRAKEEKERVEEEARRRAEEEKRRREEKERMQAELHAKELQRAKEEKERVEEEARRRAEEEKRIMEEKERMQAELHAKELQRLKEEKERLEEIHRLEEEARKLQEKVRMEEERKRREEEKKKMDELARKIEEEARQRVEREICLREEAENNLAKGIPPAKYPTGEEFEATRKRLQYREGDLHFAITGVSGAGKSSLINAFRGCSNSNSGKNPMIAKTGTSETTEQIGRYIDPDRPWLAWYDVPGAGTLKIPSWQYFNDQGLYIFDIIIIVIGDRFTSIDLDLLFNCKRFGIPAFVVRSKANAHISNIINDDSDDSEDEDEGNNSQERRFMKARDKFVKDTRRGFESILKDAGLPPQIVYIVSKDTLRSLIKDSKAPGHPIIDEVELMRDIMHETNTRHNQTFPQDT